MKCPRCEAEVEGRFCGLCGAALEERRCSSCGSSVPAGRRFCSECGLEQAAGPSAAPVPRGGGEGSEAGTASPDRRGWWIVAAAVVGGVLFLSVPYVWTGWADGGSGERMPMGPAESLPAPGPAPGVDLSSMTPREAADRLYNRVMTALGEGDDAEVESFLPMAIDAYRLVPDLDADGHFHLSLLQQAAGDHRGGLETAERALSSQPDHLLALYAAGEAARELGETERARDHFQHLLEVFDEESARELPEYQEHGSFLPAVRGVAREFLAAYDE